MPIESVEPQTIPDKPQKALKPKEIAVNSPIKKEEPKRLNLADELAKLK